MTTADKLVDAIKERIAAGHDKEAIKQETLAAGHDEHIFEAAYTLAEEMQSSQLPDFWNLWTTGFAYVRREWRFTLLLSIPLIVAAIAEVVAETTTLETANLLATGIGWVGTLVYLYMLVMLIGVVVSDAETNDYRAAKAWANRHGLSLVWVYVLVLAVITGGYVLFIIPGLIMSIWLYFSVYAAADDGLKGERALLESRRLFKGRFWVLFGKILGLGLVNISVIMLATLGLSFLFVLSGSVAEPIITGGIAVALQVIAAGITVLTIRAGFVLYRAAKETGPDTALSPWPYRILAMVGVLVPLLLLGGLFYLYQTEPDRLREILEPIEMMSEEQTQVSLSTLSTVAISYQDQNEGSLFRVCEVLEQVSDVGVVQACNDTPNAWALTTMVGVEQWCVDSTGFTKQLPAPLEERATCIPR
jgi:hypothetical protein